MAVYNRAPPGKPKNLWISYAVTEQLRQQHGLPERTVREPAGTGDERMAKSFLAGRRREVRDGTWQPKVKRAASSTLTAYAENWCNKRALDGVRTAANERQRLVDYVLPVIGGKALADVRRADVVALMAKVQAEPSKHTGKPHSPRTVHRIYEALRTLYNSAVLDELVMASPCTLRIKRGELPAKKDADPRWRSGAVFTRDEVVALISDPRVPENRRVLYALAFLTGSRLGEMSGRRWQDYDPDEKPLGRLVVATQYDDAELKGGRPTRLVPVHPALAQVLDHWRRETWTLLYGRAPTAQDFIVPKRSQGRGTVGLTEGALSQQTIWGNLQVDLGKLGLRRRRVHDARRTFVSMAVGSGADKYLLQWITHGPQKVDAFDDYNTPPWHALCAQVLKLDVQLP